MTKAMKGSGSGVSRISDASRASSAFRVSDDRRGASRGPLSRVAAAWKSDTWVKPFFARYWRVLALALFLGLVAASFAGALMFTSGYMISLAATLPFTVLAVHVPSLYVRIFGVGKPVLSYLERLVSHDWALRMTSELRRRLYRAVDEQSVGSRAVKHVGEVLGLLAEDIEHVQNLYLRTVFPLAISWLLYVLVVVALGVFDAVVALALALLLGVVVLVLPVVSVCVNGARLERAKALKAQLYADLTDNVLGVADWVYSGRSQDYLSRHEALQRELELIDDEVARFGRMRDLLSQVVFGCVAVMLLVWAGGVFAGSGAGAGVAGGVGVAGGAGGGVGSSSAAVAALAAYTPENALVHAGNWIAAFVLCIFPLIESFAPTSEAAMGLITYGDSIERMNRMSGIEEVRAQNICDESSAGAVERVPEGFALTFSNVSFAYPGSSVEVLKDVNLHVPEGERVAVLGRSGAGKSTLVSLLKGDWAPSSGRVQVGGVDAADLGETVSRYVGVIQQSPHLFNWTLRENLALGKPSATDAELAAVLEQVGLGSLLARLPQGLSTMVDERGRRFSGGERHRIALARVLLADVPVVVLDEPFAGLDPATEQALIDTMFSVLEGRTVIMVTHHLQGVAACDRVLFVADGGIAIDGSPAQLERENAYFRSLLAADRGW